uniref:Zinc finger C2HC-type containing 1C n=1 Tax=Salvator merianae TaxID=96440 RepID=A0A8D0DQP0_SALMN
MAQLQLAVCSPMDPVATNSSIHATSQQRYHPEVVKEQIQLECPRTNIQPQFLCNKDKKMTDLHIQKGWSSSCSQLGESSPLVLEKTGFCSAGPHNFKSQANTLPFHWKTKRREGVDRAYPLKPICNHKDGNVLLPSSCQVGNQSTRETPNSSSSENKRKSHALKAQPVAVPSPFTLDQSKRAPSHSMRAELGYIQKLEAAGQCLEEEIQRKEALLREKLKRTEEELRRIQRERQQAEAETKSEKGGLWMPGKKAAGITQSRASSCIAQPTDDQKVLDPEGSIASAVPAPLPQALHMEQLKKQRLVASNNKIRENISQISPACSSELSSVNDQASPAAALLGAVPCMVDAPASEDDWGECHFCGRKLYSSRLAKHISVCSKNHGAKRKVFDSSKARAKGTELETYHLLKGLDTSKKKAPNQSSEVFKQNGELRKQNNWRQKHESFILTLRRAREVQRVISKGGKASDLPPAPAMENPDYKLCPYCTRQFAPNVAERHIPKCKNIKNRPPPPQQNRRC